MVNLSKKKEPVAMSVVNTNADDIDIGGSLHFVAVGEDKARRL